MQAHSQMKRYFLKPCKVVQSENCLLQRADIPDQCVWAKCQMSSLVDRAPSYHRHDCNSSPSALLPTFLGGVAYSDQRKKNYPVYLCKFLSLSFCSLVFLPSCQDVGNRTVSLQQLGRGQILFLYPIKWTLVIKGTKSCIWSCARSERFSLCSPRWP